jgi:phosphatidate phosphatase APP1
VNKIPVIWQLSVIQFELGTAVSGVALAKMYSSTYPEKFFRHQVVAVLRSYINKPYARKELFIIADKKMHVVTTTSHGKFSLWMNGDCIDKIEIYADAACKTIVPEVQHYPVYYPLGGQQIEIISDIDDTILQSFTNSFLRRVSTILFKQPDSRKMVDFTRSLLITAKESGMRVYCISRSEVNLIHLLTNILALHHITDAIVYLFDYLNYSGLLTARKKHFKFKRICSILQKSPARRYFLIGDDTQDDIQIYCMIAEQFPGRICRVFIRKTKAYNSLFQKFYYERLHKLKIPTLYFDDEMPFDASILKNINC